MSPPRHRARSRGPREVRTRVVEVSRSGECEPLRCCRHCLHQIRCWRELRTLEPPTSRAHHPTFLESLPLEDVKPLIGARVNEQLEMRVERELVLARVDGEFHAAKR